MFEDKKKLKGLLKELGLEERIEKPPETVRVLITQDDPNVVKAAIDMFSRLGISVDTALDKYEFEAKIKENSYLGAFIDQSLLQCGSVAEISEKNNLPYLYLREQEEPAYVSFFNKRGTYIGSEAGDKTDLAVWGEAHALLIYCIENPEAMEKI
jgi:hypothetical protein